MVPYHWGTFTHVTSGAFEAVTELRRLLHDHAAGPQVRVLEPGQAFEVLGGAPRAGGSGDDRGGAAA
jgi:hypothetical protein